MDILEEMGTAHPSLLQQNTVLFIRQVAVPAGLFRLPAPSTLMWTLF